MSYHVTILRTNGERIIPITKEEVVGLAKAFPEWKYDVDQDALVPVDESDEAPALWFSDGELWTKNPSNDTVTSMLRLAAHLGARVRGDELETYRTATESFLHPDDAEAKAESNAEGRALIRRTRLKQWTFNAILLGSFILVIVLLKRIGFLE
jgi:hypothetical protein